MRALVVAAALAAALAAAAWAALAPPGVWDADEIAMMRSLWLGNLPAVPLDATNEVSGDVRAQVLGHRLFFDSRLSGDGTVACASCHQPSLRFTDGQAVSRAIGTSLRNAPSIVGAAFSPSLYWDGRKDSLWSQALSPLEDPREHAGNRMRYAHLIASDAWYAARYAELFGALPDLGDRSRFPNDASPLGPPQWQAAWRAMSPADRDAVNRVFSNLGKAIAAYERLLVPGASRFDAYVEALLAGKPAHAEASLSREERRGLELFIGRAGCTQCHNGPLFTNNAFHNVGPLSRPGATPDVGRAAGLRQLRDDPFNCLGPYSADRMQCGELEFAAVGPEFIGAMRTPSLRNLASTAPYAHGGQFTDLAAVVDSYDRAEPAMIGHNEAKPLGLWPWERAALVAFLQALQGPIAAEPWCLEPPAPTTPLAGAP